jgi:3-oxoadipate enol-lactonase
VPNASGRYSADVPHCKVNGVSLYYEISGSGERLLVISGTGGDLRHTPRMTDGPLGDTFEVLGYDQRGLGQSEQPPPPYTMADYAEDAAALLDAVGWDECMVFGVSFGGMVAQELAIRHPQRIHRLVLACTSAGGRGGASYPLQELLALQPDDRAARQMELLDTRWDATWRNAHRDQVEMIGSRMGFRQSEEAGDSDARSALGGLSNQLDARTQHDTCDRLGAITSPTLVCGGRYDGIAPPANSEFLAGAIPRARLALFDGGHLFLLQDPTSMPAVMSFLTETAEA